MASSNAKSAMVAGRTVLLKGLHGVAEPALVLRSVNAATAPLRRVGNPADESTKGQYYVLALYRGALPWVTRRARWVDAKSSLG
jgi:hypothetical protein